MENLNEDLVEECCKFPKAVKQTIYRGPNVKFTTMCDKPTKGKIYDMDEKFDYVLSKIAQDYRNEFNGLEQKSKNRIMKLFNAYHEWEFPILSQTLFAMKKETKVDTARLARLMEVAGIIFNNKNKNDKRNDSYTWHKVPSSSEKILEQLIESRLEMTKWENEYYSSNKKRGKAKKQKESKPMLSESWEEPAKEVEQPVEVQVPSKPVPHTQVRITFIEELQMKYELMLDMFPKTSKKDLQKLFLQLCLKELEE